MDTCVFEVNSNNKKWENKKLDQGIFTRFKQIN